MITPSEAQELAARGLHNPVWFLKFFLRDWFPGRIPWVHRGLLAILLGRCDFLLIFDEEYTFDDLQKILLNFRFKRSADAAWEYIFHITEDGTLTLSLHKYILVEMPRGFSKTTLLNAVTIYNIVYDYAKVLAYVSESSAHSTMQLKNVTRQMTGNALLVQVFGEQKPAQRSGLTWSESDGLVETLSGKAILAKGIDSQVRGLNVDGRRPDRLIVDDLENLKTVESDREREMRRLAFFGDLLPCLPELNPKATAVALGTLLHEDALLRHLEVDPLWTVVKFGALDIDGAPLWPENLSLEKLEEKKQSLAMKGLLHVYYLEYFNELKAAETQTFRQEYFHYTPGFVRSDFLVVAQSVDPAISENKRADFCAFGVVGITHKGKIVVLEAEGKRGMPVDEQVERYFALHKKWNPSHAGVEAIAYQVALEQNIRSEMFKKQHYFEIIPIKSYDKKKEARIESLQPYYASGNVSHAQKFPLYETQLLDFPQGKKDVPDVIAQCFLLLKDFVGFMSPEAKASLEEALPDLDEVMGGDWRSY